MEAFYALSVAQAFLLGLVAGITLALAWLYLCGTLRWDGSPHDQP